ncbi:MAG: hypothetical protein E6J06_07490 [Chloroflexi bacterium]|nr:MAG: hypothetical protein E6J06_07490 [Chloroflexota bacterium]
MVRRVAGGVKRAQSDVAQRQLVSDVQLADVGADFRLELTTPGDEIVVQVRVEGMGQLDVQVGSEVQVAFDVAEGVDDQPDTAVGVRDDEARVAQLGRGDCLDRVHVRASRTTSGRS